MISITDLRHAFRHVRQSAGFAATAILTFALAIGANSAIFSAVNTVLLRPLPVDAPGQLAVIWQTDEGGQAVIELTYRHIYDPALQVGRAADNIVVRTSSDPLALAAPVRAIARELDPAAIVDDVTTMPAVVGRAERHGG